MPIRKKGDIKIKTSPNGYRIERTGYTFYSYDKNSAALVFTFIDSDNAPVNLSKADVQLLLISDNGDEFPVDKDDIDVISAIRGTARYVIPENLLGYEGKITGNIYLDFEDGSHTDEGKFTFNIKRSAITDLAPEFGKQYVQDFEDVKERVEQAGDSATKDIEKAKDNAESQIGDYVGEVEDIRDSISSNLSLKSEDFELGTITDGNPVHTNLRARTKNVIRVSKGDIIKFKKDPTMVNYGVSARDLDGVWNGIDYGWLNQEEFAIKEDSLVKLNIRYVDDRIINEKTLKTLTEDAFVIVSRVSSSLDTTNKNTAIASILVEYGRIKGASYVFARIPKTANNGKRLFPKVALTSSDGSLNGDKRPSLRYARDNDCIFTVNAGLFNMTTFEPVGQLIIDGVSLINTPMESDNGVPIHPDECYPLAIDSDGNLTTYPRNADTADMIADGVQYAVTAWGKLVDNFEIATTDIENEIVHGDRYIRQSIGQYQNGDYCVCTVDMTRGTVTNEAGLYYKELAQIFVDKGVKFAYSLDGGGSAQTVIGKRQLNPIYEGTDGRPVPTVITFDLA